MGLIGDMVAIMKSSVEHESGLPSRISFVKEAQSTAETILSAL